MAAHGEFLCNDSSMVSVIMESLLRSDRRAGAGVALAGEPREKAIAPDVLELAAPLKRHLVVFWALYGR